MPTLFLGCCRKASIPSSMMPYKARREQTLDLALCSWFLVLGVYVSVFGSIVMADQAKSMGSRKRKRDESYGVLQPKKAPNRLVVDKPVHDEKHDNNSVVVLYPDTMEILELFLGDAILIKRKKRRDTVCVVIGDDTCDKCKIWMNMVVRSNLRARLGDVVSVYPCPDVRYAKRVHILPLEDTTEGLTGNLYDAYLNPYFMNSYRPVREGDILSKQKGAR